MSKPKTLAGKTLVDTETGKYLDGKKFIVYNNKTAEQQEKEAEQTKEKSENFKRNLGIIEKELLHLCGHYFHLWYQDMIEENKKEEDKLLPQMAVRLLRLACEMDYNNVVKNIIFPSDELCKVLKLKEREMFKTIKYLEDNGFIEILDNKKIKILKFVNRGSLNMERVEILQNNICKVFNNGFKELYDNLYDKNKETGKLLYNSKKQKNLFYFILLLPYCNIDYNVICKNPLEKDGEKIQPLSWKEIFEILGVSERTSSRVKKLLFSLQIKDRNAIMELTTGTGKSVTINPRLFYRGKYKEFSKQFSIFFN